MFIMKSRSYVITYFIKDGDEVESGDYWRGRFEDLPRIRYAIGQVERCPETQRLHLQAYLEFTHPTRIKSVQEVFNGCHCETRRGTREQARDYCSKEETRVHGPWEHGKWETGGQGSRVDMSTIFEDIKSGASELEIAERYPTQWVRYYKAFERYRGLCGEKRKNKSKVIIHYGVAGAGKTYKIFDEHGKDNVFMVHQPPKGGTPWFDGYFPDTHKCVVFDDFYGWIQLTYMLKLLDAYPMQVQIKGGFLNFKPEFIYLTSNHNWDEWYNWDEFGEEVKKAFKRRIDEIVHFPYVYRAE